MANLDLLSSTSRVEVPFIIATIGGYTFGSYNKENMGNTINVNYPNYMQSLEITKINGTVNTYTLSIKYSIRQGEDPNLFEKIFSRAKNDRLITLTYGDYTVPSYIYKEEECMITDIKSNFDFNSMSIQYTIKCISKAGLLNAGKYYFHRKFAKPSDEIKRILYSNEYNLLDIFKGMYDRDLVNSKGLIASDDLAVTIEAKECSIFEYLNYLVSCMLPYDSSKLSNINSNKYVLAVYDDISGDLGGTYFKVSNIVTTAKNINSLDTFEIDIGYPSNANVMSFNIDDSQTYSLLYDYSGEIKQPEYIYRINDEGDIETTYSPNITNNTSLMKTTAADKSWWTQVTQYPINATLTLKGLLKPAVLMTYVKLNVLMYGRKHISSGLYIITKQVDTINATGYRTSLRLTRVGGDTDGN